MTKETETAGSLAVAHGSPSDNIAAAIIAGTLASHRRSTMEMMDEIVAEHPLASEYESDARNTWPARWDALRSYLANAEGETRRPSAPHSH